MLGRRDITTHGKIQTNSQVKSSFTYLPVHQLRTLDQMKGFSDNISVVTHCHGGKTPVESKLNYVE